MSLLSPVLLFEDMQWLIPESYGIVVPLRPYFVLERTPGGKAEHVAGARTSAARLCDDIIDIVYHV